MDHELIRTMAEFGLKAQEQQGLLGKFLGLFQPKRILQEALKTEMTFQTEANETWAHLKRGQIETKALLKPLKALFYSQDEVTAIDTEDEDHLEMLEAIEEAILIFYEHRPEITDTDVLMALDHLFRFLGRDNSYAKNSLAAAIETKLRSHVELYRLQLPRCQKVLELHPALCRTAQENGGRLLVRRN